MRQPAGPDAPDDDNDAEDEDEDEDEGRPGGGFGGGPQPGSPFDRTGRKTPVPALINITIPAGTLLGRSDTPADVGTWGLMDAATVRDLIEAASRHPRTRWCYTVTGTDGEAIAHACARGSHRWPAPRSSLAGLLAELNATPEPIARTTCDHSHHEDRYTPSRKLKHLIRARTPRCCAPGWKLDQTEPGIMRWTTPAGRTYTTRPTQYEE